MVVLTIFSVLTRILGFVFRIYLSRMVSTEMLGVYTVALSIFVVFATALNSGLPVTISKLTAEQSVTKNQKTIFQMVTAGLIVSIVLSLILIGLLLLSQTLFALSFHNLTAYYLLITMAPAILFTGVYAPFRGYLWGKEHYLKVSIVEFVEQIVRIVSCFALFMVLNQTNGIFAAGISLSVACVLSTVLGIVFFVTAKGKLEFHKGSMKPVLKSSSTITGIRVLSSLMQPLLAFLLPLRLVASGYSHSQALSQLGIAMGMTVPLLMIPSTLIGSLAMAIIPKVSSLMKEQNVKEVKRQVNNAVVFTLCSTFLAIPFFMGAGVAICEFLFHNSTAGDYLVHSSWLMIFTGISQVTTSILNSLGLEVKTFVYYIISSVFLLGSVFVLPQLVGIYALLYGLGISSIIVSVLNVIKINKTIGNKKLYLKELALLTIITIPVTFVTKWSYSLLVMVLPVFVSLILVGLLSLVCIFALLLATGLLKVSVLASYLPKKKKGLPNNKHANANQLAK